MATKEPKKPSSSGDDISDLLLSPAPSGKKNTEAEINDLLLPVAEEAPLEPSSAFFSAVDFGPALEREFLTSVATGVEPVDPFRKIRSPLYQKQVVGQEFGVEPKFAVTGREQAEMMGLSPEQSASLAAALRAGVPLPLQPLMPETVSPAGLAGGVLEMMQDPTGVVMGAVKPALMAGSALAKTGARAGLEAAGKAISKGSEFTAKPAAETMGELAAMAGAAPETRAAIEARIFRGIQGIPEIPERTRTWFRNLAPAFRANLEEQLQTIDKLSRSAEDAAETKQLLVQSKEFLYGNRGIVPQSAAALRQTLDPNAQNVFSRADTKIRDLVETTRLRAGAAPQIKTASDAGFAIRQAYDQAVDSLFNQATIRYSNIAEKAAEVRNTAILPKSKANEIQKINDSFADQLKNLRGRAERIRDVGLPQERPMAQAELETINTIVQNVNSPNIGDAVLSLQSLGTIANKRLRAFGDPTAPLSISQDFAKKIYPVLRDTIIKKLEVIDTVKKTDLAGQLRQSNEQIAKILQQAKTFAETLHDAKLADDVVFDRLVMSQNTKPLQDMIEVFKTYDPSAIDKIRAGFLESAQRAGAGDLKQGQVSIAGTLKALESKANKRITDVLFTDAAKEGLDDYKNVLKIGMDLGTFEFNPSRSGVVSALLSPLQTIGSAVALKVAGKELELYNARQVFRSASLEKLIELKQKGDYPADIIDTLIEEKKAFIKNNPALAKMYRELSEPDYIKYVEEGGAKILDQPLNSQIRMQQLRAYLSDMTKNLRDLQGLAPMIGESKLDKVSRIIGAFRAYQQKYPGAVLPYVVGDAEEKEIFRNLILASPMKDNMTRARMLLNLDSSNRVPTPYLLIDPREPQRSGARPEDARKKMAADAARKAVAAPSPRPEVEAEKPSQ